MYTLYKKHKKVLIFMVKYAILIVPHNQIFLFKLSFVFLFNKNTGSFHYTKA